MGMMGALMTPLLAVSLPWATPSPQPTVTVTQTASPVPSAAGVTAEQVAEVQHSFWFKALQWFLGVPLQILIVVVVTIIVNVTAMVTLNKADCRQVAGTVPAHLMSSVDKGVRSVMGL